MDKLGPRRDSPEADPIGDINTTLAASGGEVKLKISEQKTGDSNMGIVEVAPRKRDTDHRYTFHLPHPGMLDVEKVQQDLSMAQPLAILEHDGKVGYVVAKEVLRKAELMGEQGAAECLIQYHGRWTCDGHRHTGNVVRAARSVVQALWPNRPDDDRCTVTLVDVL